VIRDNGYLVGRWVGAFYSAPAVSTGAGRLAWGWTSDRGERGEGERLESELGYRAAIHALRGTVKADGPRFCTCPIAGGVEWAGGLRVCARCSGRLDRGGALVD
jgi:hypothetical protein